MVSNPLSPIALLAAATAFLPLDRPPVSDAVLAAVHGSPVTLPAATVLPDAPRGSAWEQMDVWWSENGTMLILDAIRPMPSRDAG